MASSITRSLGRRSLSQWRERAERQDVSGGNVRRVDGFGFRRDWMLGRFVVDAIRWFRLDRRPGRSMQPRIRVRHMRSLPARSRRRARSTPSGRNQADGARLPRRVDGRVPRTSTRCAPSASCAATDRVPTVQREESRRRELTGFEVTELADELVALIPEPRLEESPGFHARVGLRPSREVNTLQRVNNHLLTLTRT